MHDPMTVAFDVPNPFWWRRDYDGKLKPSDLATIWHVDPERDGSDDSCGWFIRCRHCDQAKLDKIASRFTFEWSSGVPCGWFADNGEPNYSCQAITLGMFLIAANIHFGHWSPRAERFLNRNLHNILHFAENNCDSFYTFIVQPYGRDNRDTTESRAKEAAQIVYSWICRADRPWWRHPRWHIWHWKIQVHGLQNFKRWAFSRCCVCGKRFRWAESPTSSNWHGTGPLWFRSEQDVHHSNCSGHSVLT